MFWILDDSNITEQMVCG